MEWNVLCIDGGGFGLNSGVERTRKLLLHTPLSRGGEGVMKQKSLSST